ncbi:Shedu immune nuclease family protein [Pararhizobium haloflavum]|uniref:Shedu immune nuclease family protein n=1 Tax=Pararhizobium haloflavum TaxID=2037914 RepID=UPI000C19694C|nr:Shedu immune nuclease family protein [Pararhizobium haloflavum]
MSDDIEYLANYRANQLYTHPGKAGAYATIVGESEQVFGEIDVTGRCKLAVSTFYVSDKANFGTLKITKLRFHKTYGWQQDGHIQVNNFQLAQINDFLAIISNLDFNDAQKTRISLDNLNLGALNALLSSSKGAQLIHELAESPDLHHDIYAVAAKRKVLSDFEAKLGSGLSEPEWQSFFESNPWIFGHGLNYVFLDKAADALESRTTGNTFDKPGKTVDALLRTRAEISQYVLVEIKKDQTALLRSGKPYRAGCWGVSDEVSNAVTQIQKTAFEFGRTRFREALKNGDGTDIGESTYSIEPRSYLVVGNLSELIGNDDKIACFELYRRNIRAPEILTFDELFHRAKFIVANISREAMDGAEVSF